MGPTCEILLETDDGPTQDRIDEVLASVADRIDRTRKGRVWDVWIHGRPLHVIITSSPPVVTLSAGCNSYDDVNIVRELAECIVNAVGGLYSGPEK